LAGTQGNRLVSEEAQYLGEAARRFHGDGLLWVGCNEATAGVVRGCMVRHRLFASEESVSASDDFTTLRCALEAVPLPNNSLDAMVLHHALEVTVDPRSALREAARVLAPGGRLVICAINPLSLWGARALLAPMRNDAFSGLKLVTSARLLDWLALLGFERQAKVRYLAYNLPFGRGADRSGPGRTERLMKRLQPPFGGVYVISVMKQAAASRLQWQGTAVKGRTLLPAAYPKSAVNREPAPVLRLSDWKDLERGR
jgi:SAM-dependent methyltransferase